ncbi:CPBP family intramembrane metalloprotease [Tessaracoccus sp. OS52]|uniref:CPBP family intramembrane glutamic endopeptidase n=1 Tax=Tessaracoccus sp. OS52 TaxID=2886691 RepID=UPI001D11059E|nr:CPBP family intramembrane metalloprotease [Tessaracoccus sp. OS52]
MSQQLVAPRASDPPGAVGYPLVLTGPDQSPAKHLTGVMVTVLAFVILVPLTSQLILRITWLARGRPPFDDYSSEAMAYVLPEGLAASHLGLAMLIPISLLAVRYLHGRSPGWLVSVQPGFRWRYLAATLLVALVVLNGVLWLSFLAIELPVFQAPQPQWAVFLGIILITSPLQALAEEFFFRGYVLQALGSAFNQAWVGIIGSTLLFALFHGVQNPALFVDRLAFGVLVGWLVLRTGGLEAAIGAHVVNNVFAFGYGIFTGGVAATKAISVIGWDKAFFDVLGFGLFAVAAWWVGRRMNVATVTPD